jgi:hypothetical protein
MPDSLQPVPHRNATVRLSQRELTRISCGVVAFIMLVLGFLGYRAMLGFKANHDLLIAKENLHRLHQALYNYAQDWDQRLPPAEHWSEAISGYLSSSSGQPGGPLASLHGPGDGAKIGYVYNDLAAGYSLESGKRDSAGHGERNAVDGSRMVLLIERPGAGEDEHVVIPPQGNATADKALFELLAFPHGADDAEHAATVVLYANGSQSVLIRRDFR